LLKHPDYSLSACGWIVHQFTEWPIAVLASEAWTLSISTTMLWSVPLFRSDKHVCWHALHS